MIRGSSAAELQRTTNKLNEQHEQSKAGVAEADALVSHAKQLSEEVRGPQPCCRFPTRDLSTLRSAHP
eukprot:5543789-Prymnesium_polylepis.9